MRIRTTAILATAALGLAIPASGLAGFVESGTDKSTSIGTGKTTCVLAPGADCRGVVQRWTVEHHGNLQKAKFTRADLRGADFQGADLRGADFRGAKLHQADFRGAKLRGARFDTVPKGGKREKQASCLQTTPAECQGANLSGANFSYAILYGANLSGANLTNANLTWAILTQANLSGANFFGANLSYAILPGTNLTNANLTGANLYQAKLYGANLTQANLTYAYLTYANLYQANLSGTVWNNTTCPNGTVTSTGLTSTGC